MIEIRETKPEEFDQVISFYRANDYFPPISEKDGQLLGALRLVAEAGVIMLHCMRMARRFRRKGIGTRMLGRVHELVGNSGCFCIPYTHLRDFYAQIGFEEINLRATPRFPSACYTLYKLELGLDVIIMQRTR